MGGRGKGNPTTTARVGERGKITTLCCYCCYPLLPSAQRGWGEGRRVRIKHGKAADSLLLGRQFAVRWDR